MISFLVNFYDWTKLKIYFSWQQIIFPVLAERAGFEPAIPFWGIPAFQASLFSHSSTSPNCTITQKRTAKV